MNLLNNSHTTAPPWTFFASQQSLEFSWNLSIVLGDLKRMQITFSSEVNLLMSLPNMLNVVLSYLADLFARLEIS